MYWFYLNKEQFANRPKIRYFVSRNGRPFVGLVDNQAYVFVSFLNKFGALRETGQVDMVTDGYWTEEKVDQSVKGKFWIEITSRQASKMGFEIAPGQVK